jgi:hypothetical protein
MSGHALDIKSPCCGKWGAHRVLRTLPAKKTFPDRMRVKQCTSCSEEFCTTEIPSQDYQSLYFEKENLESEVAELRATNKRLQEAVDCSTKHLSPVATRSELSTQHDSRS